MNPHANRIWRAIQSTIDVDPRYWRKTLEQRTTAPVGSRYTNMTPQKLESLLLGARCRTYSPSGWGPNCTAFRAGFGGRLGVIPVDSIAAGTPVYLLNWKNFGEWSLVAPGNLGPAVDFTTVILGMRNGREIVFTVHPGALSTYHPVTSDALAACGQLGEEVLGRMVTLPDGSKRIDLELQEAMALGTYTWAKID